MTKIRDPKLKKIVTKFKNMFRRSRRAKRAGVLDAVSSSGARSAPELRPASGSRGHAPDHKEIRNCQPLKMKPGNLRKCLQPLTSWNNFLNQRQGYSRRFSKPSARLETDAEGSKMACNFSKFSKNGSQTSVGALGRSTRGS